MTEAQAAEAAPPSEAELSLAPLREHVARRAPAPEPFYVYADPDDYLDFVYGEAADARAGR